MRIYNKTGNARMRKGSIDLVEVSVPTNSLAQRVLVNNISRSNASPVHRPTPSRSQPLAFSDVSPSRSTSIPSLSLGEAALVLATGPANEKEHVDDLRSLPPLNTDTSVFEDLSILRCSSPVPMTSQDKPLPICSGDCVPSPTLRPMVVCSHEVLLVSRSPY